MIEGMFRRKTKKEILEWLEWKEQEFYWKENRSPHMSNE
jgi:hypothetical protein